MLRCAISGELDAANELLDSVRASLAQFSAGDPALLWALRRKVYKELTYDERGKPMHRRKLKQQKHRDQQGICPVCRQPLPDSYAVFDRIEAMAGYTAENTRRIHQECYTAVQRQRRYA